MHQIFNASFFGRALHKFFIVDLIYQIYSENFRSSNN